VAKPEGRELIDILLFQLCAAAEEAFKGDCFNLLYLMFLLKKHKKVVQFLRKKRHF